MGSCVWLPGFLGGERFVSVRPAFSVGRVVMIKIFCWKLSCRVGMEWNIDYCLIGCMNLARLKTSNVDGTCLNGEGCDVIIWIG